jgi:hypothetical protein
MESLVATRDPVLQAAARIAGFAEAMVQDTEAGRVVLCRHRFGRQWEPFGHLEPGECALNAFYGTAFWERDDVMAMYRSQEDRKASSLLSVKGDISKDFLKDIRQHVTSRIDGKNGLIEAIGRMGRVRA